MANHIITSGAISLIEIALLHHSNSIAPTNLLQHFLSLAAAQYLLIKLFYVLIWPIFCSPLRNLPGPKGGLFLLGQILNQMKALPSELEILWMKEHPDAPFIRYLSLLNREVLMVNNAHAHKAVLQTKCYSFVKPPFWERIVGEIAGKGILFTEGQEHRRQRKLLIAPFSFGNIRRLCPFFQQKARETSAIIYKSLEQGDRFIDVSELLSRTTLDIVGLAALGYELNSLSTSSELATHYSKIFEFVTPLQVAISFVNQFIPIRSVLPFEANRSYINANAQVRRILRRHIRQRRDEYRQGKVEGEKASRDLLTLMIEESKDAWSEEEMLGYLLNFMSAGHETTAGALTWALYVLTLHPDIQKRVRDEVQAKLTSLSPTQSELENLPYMNNFLSEVLRVYPPAPNFHRQAAEDVEIEGVKIPKGTLVMIAPAAAQFNPLLWGSTADTFNPDRWDNLPEPAKDPYISLAFSNGPRVCIGKHIALLEMKVIMAELISNFEFENTGPVKPQKSGPSLRPLNGMRLRVSAVRRD
ncbi:cytochrome P450 3A5 [Dactylonectria macrodidyma]|uniref:Cytochrome P450 3A5 n=1 Tax=Dactylonectria macrodidyma TaxID=307937 RepID=A0A9P9I8C2_9HYPO|nr:cytochrome P450 3A5 [Dactylonectria macrodidyma]